MSLYLELPNGAKCELKEFGFKKYSVIYTKANMQEI